MKRDAYLQFQLLDHLHLHTALRRALVIQLSLCNQNTTNHQPSITHLGRQHVDQLVSRRDPWKLKGSAPLAHLSVLWSRAWCPLAVDC
ncbi:hypothetical protein EYF80_016300 [Liparis tanakae]|uniref:Uncharacterized protein n=1 Tax=Liparis tanakae TaxID=230148 RepID=A0A4Z2I6R8_9TELE|nr:hypothetical protein EYF80_016300 [Liparis tanakae]